MTVPTKENIQASITKLKSGTALPQLDISNIAWAFTFHPEQDRFLLETNLRNKQLAETLIIFKKRLSHAANQKDDLSKIIDQLFLHYVINTDGLILEGEGEDHFDVFDAATRYAKSLNMGVSKDEKGESILHLGNKEIPCPEWNVVSGWSAAWTLRRVGPVINRVRYGRDDVIPSAAFGFDEDAIGHTLENAMTLADFSHLAYLSSCYAEKQLSIWGYDSFHWIKDIETDTQAFVAGKGNHLVVCFRGTSSKKDVLVDLKFMRTEAFGGRGKVHRGFNAALDSVWNSVQAAVNDLGADKKLFICGHSLGAGLAQLAAHRLALSNFSVAGIYVYGSPRIGNRDFMEAYNELLKSKTFLHINNKDVVTRVPLKLFGFHHLGGAPRVFNNGHEIGDIPIPDEVTNESIEDADFESLDMETQETIRLQMNDLLNSIEASTRFLTTDPTQLKAGDYSTQFDKGAVDEHSMDQYLFKFACAIVDGEWARME